MLFTIMSFTLASYPTSIGLFKVTLAVQKFSQSKKIRNKQSKSAQALFVAAPFVGCLNFLMKKQGMVRASTLFLFSDFLNILPQEISKDSPFQ